MANITQNKNWSLVGEDRIWLVHMKEPSDDEVHYYMNDGAVGPLKRECTCRTRLT